MKKRYNAGFTLIELMITVAIVAIVASIASYSYGGYVQKANRTDARAALSRVATSLEKCRALYSVYNHANCNVKVDGANSVDSEEGFYKVTGTFNASGTTFTLTAAPVAGERQATDAECGSFTLSNTGVKGVSGSGGNAVCW